MRLATILDSGAEVPVLVDPDRGVVPVSALTDRDVPSRAGRHRGRVVRRPGQGRGRRRRVELRARRRRALHRALPPTPQDLGHRPQLRRARGRPVRGRAGGAGVVHQGRPHHHRHRSTTSRSRRRASAPPPRASSVSSSAASAATSARRTRSTTSSASTTILDQTAEDILQRNPRFLTRSKNFPGFFSFGPEIVPMAEVRERFADIADVEVSTVVNGDQTRTNTVANMRYSPAFLVALPQRGDAALPRRRHLHRAPPAPSTCARATSRSAASPASGCWSTRSWTARRERRRPTGGRGGRPRPSTRPGRTPSRGASTTPRRARPTASRGRCTPATRRRRRGGRTAP